MTARLFEGVSRRALVALAMLAAIVVAALVVLPYYHRR